MAVQYAPLFSLETQFQAKDGSNNTAGWLKVYLAATDDPAETYSDYLGTRNPEKIVLDDNGRAVVICDKAKAYRLEVYDADGMLLWTEEPVYCSGTGGGGVSVTDVVSTDGSIAVEYSIAGSMRTYDLSIAPDNAKEFLEWVKCSNTVEEDGYVYPLYGEGTMQTQAGKGLEVFKDRYYHLTNKITVIPSGSGINYETITVQVMHDDDQGNIVSLCSHDFDIDNSVSDKVELEFSEDIIPEDDGFLIWRVTGRAPFNSVGLDMQIHRVYSGINAVPGTCATKQWVEENFSGASVTGTVTYAALEYNQSGDITGISGSSIYGGLDSAAVSAIASGYASSKVDSSSMTGWIPYSALDYSGTAISGIGGSSLAGVGGGGGGGGVDSATVSAIASSYAESAASGKLDGSASSDFYSTSNPSGFITGVDLSGYATEAYVDSSVSGKLDTTAFSAVSGDFLTSHQSLAGYATESYVDSAVSGKLDVTATSEFLTSLPSDLAYTSDVASAVSGKLDASASSSFYPMTGNPSGFLTAHQSLAGYATEEYVDSAVSGKLDSSAYDSSWFQPASSMSSWIPYAALDYSGTAISGIGGSSLAGIGGGGGGHTYTGISPVVVDNVNDTISVQHRTLCVDSTMTAYDSGSSAVIGVNTAQFAPSGDYVYTSALGTGEI